MIILFIAAVIPLLILSFYTKPILDDYVYTLKLIKRSIFEVQIYEYMNWGSRYTSTGILITNPIHFGWFGGYHIIAFFMVFPFVFRFLFKYQKIEKTLLLAAFCFTYFL